MVKGKKIMSENEDKLKKKVGQSIVAQKANPSIRKVIASFFPTVPVPLAKPNIDDDFNNQPLVERITESIKYNILCFEYSISPKGGLRQWIKINISLLLLFGIPLLIFVPLATYVMSGFLDISEHIEGITQNIFASALNILKAIGVIIAAIVAIASIISIIFKFVAFYFRGEESNGKDDFIDV